MTVVYMLQSIPGCNTAEKDLESKVITSWILVNSVILLQKNLIVYWDVLTRVSHLSPGK